MKSIFTRTLQLTLTSALALFTHTVHSQGSSHALQFDGNAAQDFISIPSSPQFDVDSALTIEAWINPTKTTGGKIFSRYLGFSLGNDGDVLFDTFPWGGNANNGRNLRLYVGSNGNWTILSIPNALELNQWQHVAAVFDRGELNLYVNGNLIGNSTGTLTSLNPVIRDAIIGEDPGIGPSNTEFFEGQMDEFRYWNTALSQTEIRENMCQKRTGAEPNLVAYFRMDEGIDNSCSGGEDVCDLTGNGNHGTKF